MDGGYYIDHTQDLTERLERHNQGRVKYSKRNPPNPPLQKGGFKWDFSQANNYLPPFLKGDRGGFCCAVVFPKTTAAYSLYKHS